jgi:hypothetical protein
MPVPRDRTLTTNLPRGTGIPAGVLNLRFPPMRLLSCVLFVLSLGAVVAADEFKLEPGFKFVFNGKNLDGWQTKTAKPESLDGKTEAYNGRFKVNKDGELVIDPAVKGDVRIQTAAQFGQGVVIRFDFRPTDEKCNNDLFLLGSKFDINTSPKGLKDAKNGEWNTMEITAKSGEVEFKINGKVARTDKTKVQKSTFEIRAEFGGIRFKNIRVGEGK